MGRKKDTRPSIPEKVKIQLWAESAAHCQMQGCNKPLWYDGLTFSKGNFADMAHIIGASEDGPRGGADSERLAQDASNIILLCKEHHKVIDDNPDSWPEERLRQMKVAHNERVRLILEYPAKKSRPLIIMGAIGQQNPMFSERSIQQAMLPEYYQDRISEDWFRIELSRFNRNRLQDWENGKNIIDDEINQINRTILNRSIAHLSIFGLAPMPLLMYAGFKIGDKASCRVYEPRRNDDLDKKWAWDEDGDPDVTYTSEHLKKGTSTEVVLVLAISDLLPETKYRSMVKSDTHVFKLSCSNPVQGFLKKPSEKSLFIVECRRLLNEIQSEIGINCMIKVYPAMPASLALEFGRLLQASKDPEIVVYENINGMQPEEVIRLL